MSWTLQNLQMNFSCTNWACSSTSRSLGHVLDCELQAATHTMGSLSKLVQRTHSGTGSVNSATPYIPGTKVRLQRRRKLYFRDGTNRSSARPGTSLICTAAAAVHFTDNFDSTQQEQWQTSRKLVEQLGFSSEEANDILAKSFGWSYSDYWGEEKQATIPKPEAVANSLSLIKSVGLDLSALVKKFPEAVGLTDREIQTSLATLDTTWGIVGKNLKNLLARNPNVLGYNVDCKGDCMGECTRCWVRF